MTPALRILRPVSLLALCAATTVPPGDTPHTASRAEVVARGRTLELPGTWTPPPGDALVLHTAGFATTLCAAVFLTGLDPADAAANVGFFTGPLEARSEVTETVIDRGDQSVRLTLRNGITRVARRYGSQGCIALPVGKDSVFFTPSVVTMNLPPAATTPWPMGDLVPEASMPPGVDPALVSQALSELFGGPEAMTLAVVVTHRGRILAERYAPGVGIHTPLESWSMGKSVTGTLIARLIQMGVYQLEEPAPIPEWQRPGDPRAEIRIIDLLRMSSGLRLRAPQDPDYDPQAGYPDHVYLYTGGEDAYRWAATRPQQWKPNTVGRYRNTDPVLASYLVRLAAQKLGVNYHAFPTRVLFEKLGMRDATLYTDPYGNFLGQGYEAIAARDWARLGNLYLQDGIWNGERLLPEGYVKFVQTLAPAWAADGRPIYGGGFMWLNANGHWPVPADAFAMLGAGGQSAWMVPSHGLVIVRLGKYRGSAAGDAAVRAGTATLMRAVRPIQASTR